MLARQQEVQIEPRPAQQVIVRSTILKPGSSSGRTRRGALPVKEFDHRAVEGRDIVGLAARHEFAIDHHLLVHPLRTSIAEISLE
jgi:hypothetical protein